MMLGTKGRYAVMALVDLAHHAQGNPVTLSDIASRQEIALSYLEQLFAKLKKNELVRSVRGPGGGYVLAREADEVTIASIVSAVEESIQMTRCGQRSEGCMNSKARCLTHDLWEGLESHIFQYLNAVTLEDIYDRNVTKRVMPLTVSEERAAS